jgi:hypothetical protein
MYVILHHNKEKQYLAKKFVSNCIFFEELIKVSVIKCTNLLTQTIVSKYTWVHSIKISVAVNYWSSIIKASGENHLKILGKM